MAPQTPGPLTPEGRAHLVKDKARQLGFDEVGITDLATTPHAEALTKWLNAGMAGTMRYMHRQESRRQEPARILEGATRAIVVSRNYYTDDPPPHAGEGRVAKYARGRDYHQAMAGPLNGLASYVRELGSPSAVTRAYVDAGPVPERELAQRAGLGWIGKNTMLLNPRRGSYFFLASVLTSVDLATDPPFAADRCGSCRRCLDACPTGAFPEERVLDSRRCISYLTIEHRGDIDPSLQPLMDDWLFGCDICQEVCPWNVSFAAEASDPALKMDPSLGSQPLEPITAATDGELADRYGWTAMERTGPAGLRRNAAIALGNIQRQPAHPTP